MRNFKMFCLTLDPDHYGFIKKLGYTPVGLGEKHFNENWFTDRSGMNISNKNKYYSECTFHYWLWKNYLEKIKEEWIGFCQYRKFWSLNYSEPKDINVNTIDNLVLKEIPKEFEEYEAILTPLQYVNQWKPMKFIKKGFKIIIKKPYLFFNKNKRNINFHFDLMHGENNLSKAIDLLDDENKNNFKKFVNTQVSFNTHIMVICKSKEKLKKYYEDLFPWLEKCEKLFGFKNLKGYDFTRIYGFLAERFMSYWFQKNTKYTTMPVIFFDINKK
jgi:hypothetical protein